MKLLELIIALSLAFAVSALINYIILRLKHIHVDITGDSDASGPQKVHIGVIPRVGGISLFFGMIFFVWLIHQNQELENIKLLWLLMLSSLPVFLIALAEDLTKRISIKLRLIFSSMSALMAIYLINAKINNTHLYGLDYLLINFEVWAIAFTIFSIVGLLNAYNIVDGFNGLASLLSTIALLSLTYLGYVFEDHFVFYASAGMIAANMGFILWNFPSGKIFLGDCGSYLLGFWIALLTIHLIHFHKEISPWLAILINIYPLTETINSIARRIFVTKRSPFNPDGLHLHTLIFKRIIKKASGKKQYLSRNSKTSIPIILTSIIAIIPGLVFWHSDLIILVCVSLYIISYLTIYSLIVRFSVKKFWRKI